MSGAGTGLQISAAGDLVGEFGKGGTGRLDPRETEILFFAPIDQTFDGLATMAAHYETGQLFFEVHELTIGSSKLIPRTRFRLGQFFLGVGRLNSFHRHDWPFTSAPKVHRDFFDKEGVNDTGLEVAHLFPFSFYLDLTLGITNGWKFGHSHVEGTKPVQPTHYARLATYTTLPWSGGVQVGFNYLGRRASNNFDTRLFGVDLTAKWREASFVRFLLQSEFWYRILSLPGGANDNAFGMYIFPQYGLDSQWSVGMRLDAFSGLSAASASNLDYGLVPTIQYKASEFSTIRASYNWKGRLIAGGEQNSERIFELQAIFLLGSHPAHDF